MRVLSEKQAPQHDPLRGNALVTRWPIRRVLLDRLDSGRDLLDTCVVDGGVEQLVTTARGIAGRLGALGSISIQHVATTRGADAELPGRPIRMLSGFDRDAPCHVVLIQGTFNPPPSPPRHPHVQPQPHVLHSIVLTVDAKTGDVVGSWIITSDGGPPPDLTTLGEVTLDAAATTPLENWMPSWSAEELESLRNPLRAAGFG
jgi:hypothetical protein